MKLSTRDRWLVAILPALITLITYQYMVAAPLSREVKSLRESNASPQAASKMQQELGVAMREVDKLESDLDAEKLKSKQAGAVFPEEWKDSDRSRTLQELSRAIEASGMQMQTSALQRESGMSGSALGDLAKSLKDKHGAPDPQLWRFELTGTYEAMSALLKRLSSGPRFVVPVNIDMKVQDDSPELSWTVVLWI